MGSSSASSGWLLKEDWYTLPDQYMKNRFHLIGNVSIYAQQTKAALYMAKHHGVIISIPSQSHYWCFERDNKRLEIYRGKTINGCFKKDLGNYSVEVIYKALQNSFNGKRYNLFTNNCNDWVQRFGKGLGWNLDIGCFTS